MAPNDAYRQAGNSRSGVLFRPHTFRDRKDTAYDAARFLKSKTARELVEVVDRSTGQK